MVWSVGGEEGGVVFGPLLSEKFSKCVSRAVHSDAIRVLSPLQVGVGVPCGCEVSSENSLEISSADKWKCTAIQRLCLRQRYPLPHCN